MLKRLLPVVCVSLLGCPASSPKVKAPTKTAGGPDATVLLTADLRGYIGPCGCSENMRGGLQRTAWQVSQVRAEGQPTLLLDSGDLLFGHLHLPDDAVPQQERKAKALAEGFKAMGLTLHANGPLDDARGAAFRSALKLPEMQQARQVIDAGPVKLGVVSAASVESLQAEAKAVRGDGAQLVLGFYRASLEELAPLTARSDLGVDLLIAAHAKTEIDGEESRLVRATTPAVQVQSKGRSILRLDLWEGAGDHYELLKGQLEQERELTALDGRIELLRADVNAPGLGDEMKAMKQQKLSELVKRRASVADHPPQVPHGKKVFQVRFVPIESTLPEDEKVKAVVTAYDRDVGLINVAWAKEHGHDCPAPAKNERGFVGNEACRECHAAAFPVWEKSKHAHAYPTLEQVGKNHHLDCIGCHVTGWQKPGGMCRIDKPQGRENVGCESCHGPGSIHAADPEVTNIDKGNNPKACVGCHDPENSPHFAFDRYLPQILGKGHGG